MFSRRPEQVSLERRGLGAPLLEAGDSQLGTGREGVVGGEMAGYELEVHVRH